MLIVRPLQVGALQRVLEQDRRFYMTVSAYIGIDMQTCEGIFDFEYMKGLVESFGEDAPMLDFGMPKRQGEYLVTGAFHAPDGKSVTQGEVGVRVGDRAKVLDIYGERLWEEGKKDPKFSPPFKSLQISYKHAFGGGEFERNPEGIGYQDGKLPRIESAEQPVSSDSDKPEPAGLSILDITLPQRRRFQGTYDSNYLEDYFPGHPVDMDWALHNCAAEDQWTQGYWRGDEKFEVRNMHPEHPVLKGTLPGLYARAFVKHRLKGQPQQFAELPMNCDTIWLIPGHKVALTIWRGVTEVTDDEAQEVDSLLVAYERRGDAPRSISHYKEAMEKREAGDDPLLNYFKTPDLIPLGAMCAMEGLQKMALEDVEPSALSKNMEAKTAAIQADVDEKIDEALKQVEPGLKDLPEGTKADPDPRELLMKIRKGDVEPDADVKELQEKMEKILPGITSGDPKKLELKNFSFQKMDEILALNREFADRKKAMAMGEVSKSREELIKQIEAAKSGEQPAPDESLKELEKLLQMLDDFIEGRPMKGPLPRVKAEELIAQVDPTVLSAMQHVKGAKSAEVDDEELDRMEALVNDSVKMARDAINNASEGFRVQYTKNAHFMPEGLSPHDEPIEKIQEALNVSIKEGTELANGDFACADMTGLNLDGRDLSGAYLEQVDLSGASLKGANLDGAILARACLDGADFTGASMKGTNIGAVQAKGTRFVDCNLVDARLGRGQFQAADFTGSDLTGSDMLEISIVGCNFTNAIMPNRAFLYAKLDGCRFIGADLNTSMFAKSTCEGVDFTGANLSPSVFADTSLDGVVFNDANLVKFTVASAEEPVTMKNSRFRGAKLDKGCLREMDLEGADFTGASLESTYFGSADLTKAVFDQAYARFAQFRNAKMTGASGRDMDLREGSLAKAHLVSADFQGANLYGTDVLRATFGETKFHGANLDRTLIEDWRPE